MKIIEEIKSQSNPEQAKISGKYFKTGKGEYAEGDIFAGLSTPQVKNIVKKYKKEMSLTDLEQMLKNPTHEVRTTALLILVEQFAKFKNLQKEIVEIYLRNTEYINNWDLVDISCPKILAPYCYENHDYSILQKLADSGHLWSIRMAIVSNWYIIKQKEYGLIKKLVLQHINHKHDLIHKAMGWMLRELGKADEKELTDFLDRHAPKLPRTTLRYSLERLSTEQKKHYMEMK